MFVALAMGILIYYVYKRFFTGVVYSRSFAVTLVGMCVLTCMVTLAISTNVVISLGMVGALSIVRYRTAVKDPLDLLYLFWAITTGITAGADMYALVELAAVVIMAMIADFASHQDKARVYMMVIHYTGQTTSDDIVRAFVRTKFTVKSKTMHGDKVEMAVEVFSDGVDMPYADAIRALDGVEDLTLLQYNGEYHGYSPSEQIAQRGALLVEHTSASGRLPWRGAAKEERRVLHVRERRFERQIARQMSAQRRAVRRSLERRNEQVSW